MIFLSLPREILKEIIEMLNWEALSNMRVLSKAICNNDVIESRWLTRFLVPHLPPVIDMWEEVFEPITELYERANNEDDYIVYTVFDDLHYIVSSERNFRKLDNRKISIDHTEYSMRDCYRKIINDLPNVKKELIDEDDLYELITGSTQEKITRAIVFLLNRHPYKRDHLGRTIYKWNVEDCRNFYSILSINRECDGYITPDDRDLCSQDLTPNDDDGFYTAIYDYV